MFSKSSLPKNQNKIKRNYFPDYLENNMEQEKPLASSLCE